MGEKANVALIRFRDKNCPNLSLDDPVLFLKLIEELSKCKSKEMRE